MHVARVDGGGGGIRASNAAPAIINQESLESAYRRWDAMHQSIDRSFTGKIASSAAYRLSAWVYGSITAITESVVQAPFVIHTGDIKAPATSGPIVDLVEQPNRYDQQDTSIKFQIAYLTELLLNGAVMRQLTGLVGQQPSGMIVRPRHRISRVDDIDENGVKIVTKWQLMSPIAMDFVPNDTIYHDALFNPYDEIEGLAPLTAAVLGITNDVNVGEFASRFFVNDGSTGVVFTTDNPRFNQKQADLAAERYNEINAGLDRAFRAKFLGYGLKPSSIGTGKLEENMVRVIKSLSKDEIVTGIFKIPPEIFCTQNQSQGVTIGSSSPEPAKESYLLNVVMPWAKRYDTNFNKDVAWRFGAQFVGEHDFTDSPILERRRLDRAKQASELMTHGVPLNEVIDWLNLQIKPQPHGDEYWIANTMIPASVIMRAGDDALNLATGGASNEIIRKYVAEIMAMADTVKIQNAARTEFLRSEPAERTVAGNGQATGNGQVTGASVADNRIKELMLSGEPL